MVKHACMTARAAAAAASSFGVDRVLTRVSFLFPGVSFMATCLLIFQNDLQLPITIKMQINASKLYGSEGYESILAVDTTTR